MHEPSNGASLTGPLCNVTIPVFNRPAATERAIRALAETSREVPFCITVVDNGSEPVQVKTLLRQEFFAGAGNIDADKRIAKPVQPGHQSIFQSRDRRIVDLFLPVDIQGGAGDINRSGRFPVTFHMLGDKPGR